MGSYLIALKFNNTQARFTWVFISFDYLIYRKSRITQTKILLESKNYFGRLIVLIAIAIKLPVAKIDNGIYKSTFFP